LSEIQSKLGKILILGSGGLRIGQAGEFDYSGSQAIKALKEEGHLTVLINPNIATVQTDSDMADEVYLQPLNIETVEKIIAKEKPDGILLSVGGQTALNLGLELDAEGILEKYNIKVLGTPVKVIRVTEDRELFKSALKEIGVKTAISKSVNTIEDALKVATEIGYPLMVRSGFSLGGLGSGCVRNDRELKIKAGEALSGAPQILVEEYLEGWKEVEYEVVRDRADNTITVCNMENFDPMGVHTGESIVVAPSQTLTNFEYHMLREIAVKTVRHLGIVGECNIQYALNPQDGDYRVIEVNARLSRSSALASKATGYPLAFVSTKLALGKCLHEIKNAVTGKTTAFFEPALDYLVVKMPRWDIQKLKAADRSIGSEMKSVGEVMAIGRTFPEALQKALRMINIGAQSLLLHNHTINNPEAEIVKPTDRRLFAIAQFMAEGGTSEEVHRLSKIDRWFLDHLSLLVSFEKNIAQESFTDAILLKAKRLGFSDKVLAARLKSNEESIRQLRLQKGICPFVKQIDTLAGEFESETNYLYLTYHGERHDILPSEKNPVIVLGSGPYCIGSSVEFDWCAVNIVKQFRKNGEETIIINSNPETVSTDFDESNRLYFEELSLERIRDIADYEKTKGIVVSVGGQIANNMALPLHNAGYPIIGTDPSFIDIAENRQKFSDLLNKRGIDQPDWEEITTIEKALLFGKRVGYPLLVRPSYVLSGAAMNTVYGEEEMEEFLQKAAVVSPDYPAVISKFITDAKELEVDGVADKGEIIIEAMTEHVENAGVHSGDATIVIPPQRLYLETIRQTKRITRSIVKALQITGPFNIQFIAINNEIKVIECNVRASRSFPFVSKTTNHNFIAIAADIMLGKHKIIPYETLELDYVGVKTPQFSYSRLKGANPVAHVEMASTGEVACLADTFPEAFFMSWLATEQKIKGKRILVSIGGDKKVKILEYMRSLEEDGWEIFATENTYEYLTSRGIGVHFLYKAGDGMEPNIVTAITDRKLDLIINIPRALSQKNTVSDGFKIRRLAIDHHIPLITNLPVAQMFLQCLCKIDRKNIAIRSVKEFIAGIR